MIDVEPGVAGKGVLEKFPERVEPLIRISSGDFRSWRQTQRTTATKADACEDQGTEARDLDGPRMASPGGEPSFADVQANGKVSP
jgi:hypothetical protein